MAIALSVTFVIVLLLSLVPWKTSAPLVFTTARTKKRLFDLLSLTPDQTFVDLGCGRGNLLVEAQRRFGAKVIGLEIAPLQFVWSCLNVLLHGKPRRARLVLGDFMRFNLSAADVVFCYLLPPVMTKLGTKLQRELKPGAWFVSNTSPVPGWQTAPGFDPDQTAPLYIYRLGTQL